MHNNIVNNEIYLYNNYNKINKTIMGICIAGNSEYGTLPVTIDSFNSDKTLSTLEDSYQMSPKLKYSLNRPILHKLLQKRTNSCLSLDKEHRLL